MPSPGRWWFPGLLAVLVAGSAPRAQNHPPQDPAPLKIGLVLPPGEAEADSIRLGAEIAATLSARECGRAVDLVVRGSPGQWGTEGDDAVALALDAGAQALIAPATGTTVHLVEQVAGRTRVPVATLCGDTSVTAARIPWVVRMVPTTPEEAMVLFSQARTASGEPVRRWAVLVPEGRAGREAARDLRHAAGRAGCELAPVVNVSDRPHLLSDSLQQAMRARPEGLLLWLEPTTAGLLAARARSTGFTGVLAGPGRLAGPAFLIRAGPGAEGFWTTRMKRDTAFAPVLREAFAAAWAERKLTATEPLAEAAADAVLLLARLLQEVGQRPAFAAYPVRGEWPGISDPLRFDAVGNRLVELEPAVVRQGRLTSPDASPGAPAVPDDSLPVRDDSD